ncbi:MAG: efflux RND transporter periplasmic adaptor subunit [Phycisphaerales bacterium]|jgi:putative peptide zinc metalloprotease protein
MSERPTFSPMWSRVRAMKPRLRSHTQITRQHYRGRRWHVVHDPASNQFYRLTPMAYEFVCLLDGKRTVEETWTLCLETHGDAAPTQVETVELISQLYNANLLKADDTPETEQLLTRARQRIKKKAIGQAMGIMYFRIRLFNPDSIFTAVEPIVRPLLNRWGFIAWCLLLLGAIAALTSEAGALFDSERFQGAIAPANWPWLIVVFIVSKIIHESGHGLVCKRFGGQVPELGIMMLVMFPAPFVDASSTWAFASKWQRVAVGAAGMIFELAAASIAAFVWLATLDTGGVVNQFAYNAMLTASISTILFNANPLMRFDGYYILSDLLEAPNLMQRAQNLIKFHFQKYMYRIRNAKPPTVQAGERPWLIAYGWAAMVYRVFLFFSITLFVMGQMFGLGLVLAIWTATVWFVMPLGKWTHWLATSPMIADKRSRVVLTSIAAVGLAGLLVGAVPMPDYRRASAVIESEQFTGVFAGSDGFVQEVLVSPGQWVEEGQVLAVAENPELVAQLERTMGAFRELEARFRSAMAQQVPVGDLMNERRGVLLERLAFLQERVDALTMRAPHAGYVADDPRRLAGQYVRQGAPVCAVVASDDVRVVASMDQRQADWLQTMSFEQDFTAEIRRRTQPGVAFDVTEFVRRSAGDRTLPHPALADIGGGQVQTDRRQSQSPQATRPRFIVEMEANFDADGATVPPMPGERVAVRFELPPRPLLGQWVDRLRQLVQGRIDI